MNLEIFRGILIPFLGTTLGAACVFFMKRSLSSSIQRALTGFAAGIMTAASVWSLLIPAMEQCASMGKLAFLPAAVGFLVGIFFLLGLDHLIPHLHMNSSEAEGPKSKLKKTTMLVLAVTLHNIPEGMAVGVVYAAGHPGICPSPPPLRWRSRWASPSRTSRRVLLFLCPCVQRAWERARRFCTGRSPAW